jgi:hypothetical protein
MTTASDYVGAQMEPGSGDASMHAWANKPHYHPEGPTIGRTNWSAYTKTGGVLKIVTLSCQRIDGSRLINFYNICTLQMAVGKGEVVKPKVLSSGLIWSSRPVALSDRLPCPIACPVPIACPHTFLVHSRYSRKPYSSM